ncbi:MAG: hypothetical protein WBE13_00870 [Candidatus Acidiferrum sp.]
MKTATERKLRVANTFEDCYRYGHLERLQNPSGATLGEAYELGRRASSEGKSLLELAAIPRRAIQGIVIAPAEERIENEMLGYGAGFDVEKLQSDRISKGPDMVAMRKHLKAVGRTLSIDSATGRGTKVLMQIPWETSDANARRPRG